jgi:hypothetical protein
MLSANPRACGELIRKTEDGGEEREFWAWQTPELAYLTRVRLIFFIAKQDVHLLNAAAMD